MGMILDFYDSPIGRITLCSDGTHLTAVTFKGQKHEGNHIPKDAVWGFCPVLAEAKNWLTEYFQGNIPKKLPPVKPVGTDFQKRVWQALSEIPYGETVTYGELARAVGCKSAQAVGGAVGRNPILILIPCHRVVGTDGKLTGYAGGIEKKAALLRIEKGHLI